MKTFIIKKVFFLTRKLAKCLISFPTVFIVCEFNYLMNIKTLLDIVLVPVFSAFKNFELTNFENTKYKKFFLYFFAITNFRKVLILDKLGR